MAGHGGFDHNVQSLRVLTLLERRYPAFDGLNLTWEVIEGLAKHNGPLTERSGRPLQGPVAGTVLALSATRDLILWSQPSAEAQCAAIADDIAYDAHDIDDGLRAGLLTLEGLREVPLLGELLAGIDRDWPGLDPARLVPELIRRLIGRQIDDVIDETGRRTAAAGPKSADGVRALPQPLVGFTPATAAGEAEVKRHLRDHVYRHASIRRVMGEAEQVVARLFARYRDDPARLPQEWRSGYADLSPDRQVRRIADFLAGMTDRFALAEHARLFDRVPDFG
jgi:dGTPase